MNHLNDEELNEYLDNESQERAQIEAHLAACMECAARLAAWQALFTELEELPETALSRDLSAAVVRRVSGSAVLPKWFTLTVALQAVIVFIGLMIAAPFVIEFAAVSLPALQMPSVAEILYPLQAQWMTWLDALSTFQLPALPSIPTPQFSSLMTLATLAVSSMFWLVGNGLLLRNQIK